MEKKMSFDVRNLAVTAAIGLIAGLIGAGLYNAGNRADGDFLKNPDRIVEQKTYIEESQSIDAIQKVTPAVLSIVATKDLQTFQQNPFDLFFFDPSTGSGQSPFSQEIPGSPFQFGPSPRQRNQAPQKEPETKRQKVAGGTGFLVREDGLAVTNKHVVSDTQADYTAITTDKKEYDVEILSLDPLNDLAVIQLHEKSAEPKGHKTGDKREFGAKPKNLPSVTLGDSTLLKVGQKVFAVGNARGEYENSVTSGIISALGRQIQASNNVGGGQETLSNLIQTDAAINFGNSGGPLMNLAGEVIGINTAIDASASGIGFAIPINEVSSVLQSVAKFGKIVRPILGVKYLILNKERAEELKLKGLEYGALITGDRSKGDFGVIPESPADKAGLRVEDVILEVDGEKITEENQLQNVVRKHKPGDALSLKVWRGGETLEVKVRLEEAKQ